MLGALPKQSVNLLRIRARKLAAGPCTYVFTYVLAAFCCAIKA